MNWLYQRDDFGELVELAAERLGIGDPAIVEKDYFVTEALRQIAVNHGGNVVFKGGTSLSKGWKIIQRFSEDIDLYVAPLDTPDDTLRRFSDVAASVAAFPGLQGRQGRTDRGNSSWVERFAYPSRLSASTTLSPVVLLESGIQSADQPIETVPLSSMLADVLDDRGVPRDSTDRGPFPMRLLHFRRTFVEKLFTIHSRVEKALRQGKVLGRDARHYYDLAMLLRQPETTQMLESPEYAEICGQYRDLTQTHFRAQVQYLPTGMDLSDSPALFPNEEDRKMLEQAYEREAGALCYGSYPPFQEVQAALEQVRESLKIQCRSN